MGGKYPVVVDHNAAALLPPVLEGVEAVVGQLAYVPGPGADRAKDTAFLMNTHNNTSDQ